MTDEHTRKVLGCYGNKMVKTPHIDQPCALKGTLFENAYTPMCLFACPPEPPLQQEIMRTVRVIGITPRPILAHQALGATSYKKPVSQSGQSANYITVTQMTTWGWIFKKYQCM